MNFEWKVEKSGLNLRCICVLCKQPAGWHGASDGKCPKKGIELSKYFFKPYKDRRTK